MQPYFRLKYEEGFLNMPWKAAGFQYEVDIYFYSNMLAAAPTSQIAHSKNIDHFYLDFCQIDANSTILPLHLHYITFPISNICWIKGTIVNKQNYVSSAFPTGKHVTTTANWLWVE